MNSAYYFEELEDVRDAVHHYEKALGWAVFCLIVSIAMLIGGQIIIGVIPFLNNAGVATTVVGVFGSAASLLFGIIWLCTRGYPSKRESIYQRRREAQRRYDRELSRKGEQAAKGAS